MVYNERKVEMAEAKKIGRLWCSMARSGSESAGRCVAAEIATSDFSLHLGIPFAYFELSHVEEEKNGYSIHLHQYSPKYKRESSLLVGQETKGHP
jgi:hypothetical protein